MLKLNLKRQPDGAFEDVVINCTDGELRIKIKSINPNMIRTEITGPHEIKVKREKPAYS